MSFQCSSGGRQYTYEHSESVKGFQSAIVAVVEEELKTNLSAAQFYSLLIDESTDIATDHNLIIYSRFVLNGEVHSRFVSLLETFTRHSQSGVKLKNMLFVDSEPLCVHLF